MGKQILPILLMLAWQALPAQLNVTYKGQLNYNVNLNDIWGWADDDGNEYALVGAQDGFSIVDVSDPENPTELAFVPGPFSTWRDIKTWSHYAYVTNESGDGLLVVDLSNLPNNFSDNDWYYWAPDLPGLGVLSSIHNLYIDEFGICYLAGSNLNSGGVLNIDVATDPWNPEYVGKGPNIYSHDVYARDHILYSSEIYAGEFAAYDVNDPANPILLGTQLTGGEFTHNTWLNDAGDALFTTDEVANAPIGSYDVSDLTDIQTLDQFRPLITLGDGVVPHNVHVWDDWIIISYYTDGCIIVDGSRPTNLIEVGNFDTYIPTSTGFSGAWGAYPFLPSGLILVTDIGNGLYVLEPNYVRACWLEGNITNANNGDPILGAKVDILSSQLNAGESDASGFYSTGQAIAGDFEVIYSKPGFESQTLSLTLTNGVLTIQDVALVPLQSYTVSGQVTEKGNPTPVGGAHVTILGNGLSEETIANPDGTFSVTVFEGTYSVTAGSWGYLHYNEQIDIQGGTTVQIELQPGYQDDFIWDFDWQATGDAQTGFWVREEPIGTSMNSGPANPDFDIANDIGDICYITGNGGGNGGFDDVDNGTVTLESSEMSLLDLYNEPVINYHLWFANGGGFGDPNDAIRVYISDGTEQWMLREIDMSMSDWASFSDTLEAPINITNTMTLIVETSDLQGSGHIVEGGLDGFLVTDADPIISSNSNPTASFTIEVFPNPTTDLISINLPTEINNAQIALLAQNGQEITGFNTNDTQVILPMKDYPAGVYFLRVEIDGENVTEKIIKLEK